MSDLPLQFSRFILVGVVATIVHYTALVTQVELFRVLPVTASAFGAFLGAIVSYILNRRFTFASTKNHKTALPRFFVVAALALVANTVLMAVLISYFVTNYLFAQVITTAIVVLITFSANRFWTFGT